MAAALSACFFGIIAIFWILKPLKKALFIEHYDAAGLELLGWHLRASQAELLAKIVNTAAAFLAMWLVSALSRRFDRSRLVAVLAAFLAACCAVFSIALSAPNGPTLWAFYVFGDVFNMLLLAAFFAYVNDSVTADGARRVYGLVVLGGVLGGVFGATALASSIQTLSPSSWLGVAALGTAAVGTLARLSERLLPVVADTAVAGRDDVAGAPAALEGAKLVLGSRYLLSIAALVGLYELISTLADFQFTETLTRALDGAQIRAHVSKVFMITNAVSTGVQLFVTGFALSRLGVGRTLLVLPLALLTASLGFLALPILWVGSSLSIADNGLNYSIHQSAREALYVPTAKAEKYRAKAFIDVLVQRFAKLIAVGLGLGLSAVFSGGDGVRWVSLVTISLAVMWLAAARFAGKRFEVM
jgi:ATP:ADP antiporter, AAA family